MVHRADDILSSGNSRIIQFMIAILDVVRIRKSVGAAVQRSLYGDKRGSEKQVRNASGSIAE